jgi:hypothetical protein
MGKTIFVFGKVKKRKSLTNKRRKFCPQRCPNKADRAKMIFLSLPELLVTLAVKAPLDLKANPVHLGTLA